MRKINLLLITLALLLAACAGQGVTTDQAATEAPAPAATAAVTQAPVDPPAATLPPAATVAAPAATEASASPVAPDTGGAVTYKIVPGESSLTYEVGETFINDNNRFNVAKGSTPQVEGEIRLDKANPQNTQIGEITADISQFASDSGRRDNFIRGRFLESNKFPTVTFKPTNIEGLPEAYTDGQELTFKITGDLTVRDATKPVTFDVTAKADGESLTGVAVTNILMSDFGFGPISIGGMLNTEDQVKATLAFVARP